MSYPDLVKVLEAGLYDTCEYCGDDKITVSKIKARIYGKIETWYICDDCIPDCFGVGY